MSTAVVELQLEKEREEDSVVIFKDGNDLLYFKTSKKGEIIMGPHGAPTGYKAIAIYPEIILCERVAEVMEIYIRKSGKWFQYFFSNGAGPHREVYGKPKVVNSDFMQVCIADCDHRDQAIFLFKEDRLVPDPDPFYKDRKYGKFNTCDKVISWRGKRALVLSHGYYSKKIVQLYLIEEDNFLSVGIPKAWEKETRNKKTVTFFHFICEKYAVITDPNAFQPYYFVYDFEKNCYKIFDKENTKNDYMIGAVVCTPEYLACVLQRHPGGPNYWEVYHVEKWEEVSKSFETKLTTSLFDKVEIDKDGQMVVTSEIKTTVTKVI